MSLLTHRIEKEPTSRKQAESAIEDILGFVPLLVERLCEVGKSPSAGVFRLMNTDDAFIAAARLLVVEKLTVSKAFQPLCTWRDRLAPALTDQCLRNLIDEASAANYSRDAGTPSGPGKTVVSVTRVSGETLCFEVDSPEAPEPLSTTWTVPAGPSTGG